MVLYNKFNIYIYENSGLINCNKNAKIFKNYKIPRHI